MDPPKDSCTCTGIRFCLRCEGTPRVQEFLAKQRQQIALLKAAEGEPSSPEEYTTTAPLTVEDVVKGQYLDKGAISSCPFPSQEEMLSLWCCVHCGNFFTEKMKVQPSSTKKGNEEEKTVPQPLVLVDCSSHQNQLLWEPFSSSSSSLVFSTLHELDATLAKAVNSTELTAVLQEFQNIAHVVPGFLSPQEEQQVLQAMDHPDQCVGSQLPVQDEGEENANISPSSSLLQPPLLSVYRWKDSQSGRRKIDYGPQPNFKKRKVKPRNGFVGFPVAFQPVFQKIKKEVDAHSSAALPPNLSKNISPSSFKKGVPTTFEIAEAFGLEYLAAQTGHLDPHIDDTWIWGPRVVGVCCAGDTVMSFIVPLPLLATTNKHSSNSISETEESPSKNGTGGEKEETATVCRVLEIKVLLPARCFFMMKEALRYRWLHSIHSKYMQLSPRRVSLTIRELNPLFVQENPDISDVIQQIAATFI